MKKKSLMLALAMLALVGCNTKKDDTKEVQELKQEIEDLKANVKELKGNKNADNKEDDEELSYSEQIAKNLEEAKKKRENDPNAVDKGGLKEAKAELEKKKPSNLSDIIMDNVKAMTADAVSSITFDESVKLIENNPEIFLDDSASDTMINMFNNVFWDELYVDAKTPQPITQIEGTYFREIKASLDSDKFNVYKVGFFPNPSRDDVHYFTVFYCGNVSNYLYPNGNKNDYLKIWALPVGVYQLKNDKGETHTTYVFVSSDTFQHTAYKYFEGGSY